MFLVEWPGGSWEATARIAIGVFVVYFLIIWAALVFWTYRDIRQRSRDPIVQTVAIMVVLFFSLPGHWVYLVLRPRYTLTELYERSLEEEALLQELEDQKGCPTCKRRVLDSFLVCPSCRTQSKEPCGSCSQPLSYAWLICPYCGTEKPPRSPAPPHRAVGSGERLSGPVRRVQERPQPANRAPAPPPPARERRAPGAEPQSSATTIGQPPGASKNGSEPAGSRKPAEAAAPADTARVEKAEDHVAQVTSPKPHKDPFASSSTPPSRKEAEPKPMGRADDPLADPAD